MGLENIIRIQLRHPAHGYSCCKKSELRWPTTVAGISEIKYSKKLCSEEMEGRECMGDPEVEGWMDL
jgi:hypothetical protein